jgi:hypothetical protein
MSDEVHNLSGIVQEDEHEEGDKLEGDQNSKQTKI